MNIKKYLSISMTLIFTSVAMQISLFAPKKAYAELRSTYTVSTIAGTGTAGYSGDGGDATSAELNFPYKITVDGSGNVYTTDYSNNAIRKIDHETGKISTILNIASPKDVALDSSGNMYVCDGNNNVIKKVDHETGQISTIAGTGTRGYDGDGGAATSAKLNQPYAIAVDGSGNVYIADTYNNVIRKVDHETGKISTIASSLSSPFGVAVDNSGNVYISDTYNQVIKKIDHTTGAISIISEPGTVGCTFGVAVDNSGNVYAADANGHAIEKIDHTTGKTSIIAQDGLNKPIGVAVDANGNVYVADSTGNVIKKLTLENSYYYTVTYDGNGNTSGTAPTDSTSYNSGAFVTSQYPTNLKRDGFKFSGWNTSKDGTGIAVPADGRFNITVDTTLYAQWEQIVPASGLTVTVTPEATPVQGKVNLTVTPEAEDSNHKIFYRIVDKDPIVPNLGEEVDPEEGWKEVTDTNAHEISVTNGQYVEAAEVKGVLYECTRWGKSGVVNDGYVSSSSLSISAASFDKNIQNAKDISVTMTLNGNTLKGIRDASDLITSGLVKDRDYIVDGNTVIIKESYLEGLFPGTTVLEFNFSAGEPQYLTVTVTDTTSKDVSISPTTANFDKDPENQADVNVSMAIAKYDLKGISGGGGYLPSNVLQGNTLTIKKSDIGKITPVAELTFCDDKGNTKNLNLAKQVTDAGVILNIGLTTNGDFGQTILTGIANEGNTLVNGTDYVVNGNQVTIKKGFLTKLGTGTVNLMLNFGKENLALTISTNATDINATMTLYENTLTGITNGTYNLISGQDYTVNGNNVTIKKSYLSTLNVGTSALVFKFSEGNPQTLNVAISGTTTKSYTVTFKDYDGSIIGEPQKVNDGKSATAPAAPTRTGYVFAGWDKTFDKVTGDLTITAKYTSGNTYDFPSKPTDKPGETKISTDYLKSRDNTLVITNPAADLAIPASAIDLVDGADHIKVTEKVVTPETNTVQGLFSNLPSSVARMIGNPINLNVQLLDANDDLIKDIHQFSNNQKVKVTIKLTASQITGLDTSKLSMYYYDEISKIWAELGGSFAPNTNEFTFYTPHFTNFAIMDKVSTPTPIPTPTVSSYTVTFKDYDGTVIGTPQAVNYGGSATAPSAPTRTGYVFAGWDKAFDKITGDLVVTAKYTSGNTYNFKPTTTNNGDETKISADYLTSRDNTLVITSDNAEISIPAGAIDLADGTGYVKVVEQSEASTDVSKQYGNLPNGLKQVGNPLLISIQLFDANNNYIKDIHKLANNEKIKVTMKLTADQIKGIDPNVISMYYYDATAKAWIKLEGSFDSSTMKDTFYMTSL